MFIINYWSIDVEDFLLAWRCCLQVGQDLEEDPRLKVMKREWFEGKDCLDIGCNSGLVTISIGIQVLNATSYN